MAHNLVEDVFVSFDHRDMFRIFGRVHSGRVAGNFKVDSVIGVGIDVAKVVAVVMSIYRSI